MTVKEALKVKNTKLYFVNDNVTGNSIFSILLTRSGHWKSKSEDDVYFIEDDIDVGFQMYHKEYTEFMLHLNENANKSQLIYFIEKFSNIRQWLNCTYKPKWQKTLGDDFYNAVIKYIEGDLYLFCSSVDGTSTYEDNIDDKRWIVK